MKFYKDLFSKPSGTRLPVRNCTSGFTPNHPRIYDEMLVILESIQGILHGYYNLMKLPPYRLTGLTALSIDRATTFYPGIQSCINNVLCTMDIGLDCFSRIVLASRYLLQSSMDNIMSSHSKLKNSYTS